MLGYPPTPPPPPRRHGKQADSGAHGGGVVENGLESPAPASTQFFQLTMSQMS